MTSGETPRRRRRSSSRKPKRRLPRFGLAVVIGTLAIGLIAISSTFLSRRDAAAPRVVAAPTTVSVQLNAPFGARFAGEIVAEDADFFRSGNIKVVLAPGQSDGETIAAVVDGRALVGVVDPVSFLKARATGQPIVAFAADYVENALVFYALEKANVRAPEDFVGKRVGRVNGTYAAIFYDTLLNMRGISRSNVRETDRNINIQGLLDEAIDVIPGRVGREAYALKKAGASYNTVRLFDFGIHVPDLVYIATEKTIRDRPSLLVHLLEGVIAGWSKAYADVAEASRVVSRKAGPALPADEAAFELAAQRDFVITVGRRVMEFDELQWKQLTRILINARQLDEYFDLSRAVNYTILKDAHRKPIAFGNAPRSEPAPLLGR